MKQKLHKCIAAIQKHALDALLIANPLNITYLTGFRPAEGYLLITTRGELFYFTNFLYQEEAREVSCWKVIVSNGNIFTLIGERIKKQRFKKVGFEAKSVPFLEYERIKEILAEEGIDFIETIDLVETLRAVKSRAEIAAIKKSVSISKEAFEFVDEIYAEHMTEKGLSIEIERFLRLKGDNEIAFPPIVASGKNSAFPHYQPQEVPLESNFFLIDLGSKYYGYCADLTRVFFWGKMPHLFRKIYDIVRHARDRSIAKIRSGIQAKAVDKAAREYIAHQGWGSHFGHGTGHGVGLCVHELPYLNRKSGGCLQEGMVVTVEPAIYIKGKFGIRLEDMVLVQSNGAEVLSGNINC